MDNRKWEGGAIATPPAAPSSPSSGYPTNGDPTLALEATTPGAHWFYKLGEELRAVIVAAGLTPVDTNLAQLLAAIQALDINANAATATQLATARLIGGTSFDGSADITPANADYATNSGTSAACSGNAATATAITFRGAMAALTAPIAGFASVTPKLVTGGSWSERYDTPSGIHSGGIVTVPASGVDRIILRGQVCFEPYTGGYRIAEIVQLVGGTTIGDATYFHGMPQMGIDNSTSSHIGVIPLISPVINVSGGEKFAIRAMNSGAATLDVVGGSLAGSTWISMEIVN